ncbi:SDR family NAD(P)-dependent oxidoreductase [Liquorilactobacillus capillatus]|uniref:Short chain dehydrogenase n=1 Tax=Liquorilactobacillus capillatus DSM 19910 TaxID=1423731 RepID=A0A0R1MHF5_9LACO|nr:SDR family oxidoreductase [Liquorilactobacillus capillatus]KRL03224.1 Short chain dehydrogenase [Liquorilactobacillus capillatus DSM 19910]
MQNYRYLKDLRNRVALVTGASSGLGEQIAYQLAQRGAIVVVCARRLDKLITVSRRCQELSGRLSLPIKLDVAQPEQVERVVNKVEDKLGPLDVLVNDAGFGLMEEVLDFDMAIAEKMFRVNVLGLMYLTKYAALKMAKRKRGAIINVASVAGKIATPKAAIYSATKAAVLGYSNALRLELKTLGISVLTVNPGPIKTDFFNIADKSGHYLENVGLFVLDPEKTAQKIVKAIGTNRRELNLPYVFQIMYHCYQVCPWAGDYLAGNIFNKK